MGWRRGGCSAQPYMVALLLVMIGMGSSASPSVASTRATATPRPSGTATTLPTATPTPTDTPYTVCAPGHTTCLVTYATTTPLVGAPAPTTTVSGGSGGTSGGCDFWSIGSWGPCIAIALINNIAGAVNDLNATIGAADLWTNTDPTLTFANPVIAQYWEGVRKIADAFILFIFLGLAIEIILCINAQRTYAAALERFWRLLLVALLANGSLPVLGTAIALANAATDGAVAIQSGHLFSVDAHSDAVTQVLLGAVLGLVDGLMELLLAVQMIIRIGLLDGLLILAPAGLLCYAWPRLQGMAELWGRFFVVTLITQFIQIVILHMGEDLVLYAPLVFARDGHSVVGETSLGNLLTWAQYLVALGVFVVVLRVPRLLRGYTGTPLGVSLLALRSLTGRGGGARG